MNNINEATAQFEDLLQAHQLEWNISIGIFVLGVLVFASLVKRENGFNLRETILAVMGLKKISRTWVINTVHVLTIILPLLIVVCAFNLD